MTRYHVEFEVQSDKEWHTVDRGAFSDKRLDTVSDLIIAVPARAEITKLPDSIPEFPIGSIARRLYTNSPSFYFKGPAGWSLITTEGFISDWNRLNFGKDSDFTDDSDWGWTVLSPSNEVLYEDEYAKERRLGNG